MNVRHKKYVRRAIKNAPWMMKAGYFIGFLLCAGVITFGDAGEASAAILAGLSLSFLGFGEARRRYAAEAAKGWDG